MVDNEMYPFSLLHNAAMYSMFQEGSEKKPPCLLPKCKEGNVKWLHDTTKANSGNVNMANCGNRKLTRTVLYTGERVVMRHN